MLVFLFTAANYIFSGLDMIYSAVFFLKLI
jgi:hypothetical protein